MVFAKSGKERGEKGARTNCNIGNPDGYQKKGLREEAKGIVVKTKGIGNVAQIWARGAGLRGNPGKSGVEQFEWSLITLVSVAWRLLLSQELFYKYSNGLWKFVRTERKVLFKKALQSAKSSLR